MTGSATAIRRVLALLAPATSDLSEPQERGWANAAVTTLSRGVLVIWVVTALTGTVALTATVQRALASGSVLQWEAVVGLALVAASSLTQGWCVLNRRRGGHALWFVTVTLCVGLALAVPATEPLDPRSVSWWPTQWTVAVFAFSSLSHARRRWLSAVALIGTNAALRWTTWRLDPAVPDLDRLEITAASAGQFVAMAIAALVGTRAALDAARYTDRAQALARAARAQIAAREAEVATAQEADRLVHDEILYGLRAVALGGEAISADHVAVAASRAIAVLERTSATQGTPSLDADTVAASSETRGESSPWFMPRRPRFRSEAPEEGLLGLLAEACRECPLSVSLRGSERIWVPPTAARAIQAAIRESLRNVVRHAGVDRAVVTLSLDGGTVQVLVRDQGVGFDSQSEAGLGIESSIRRRLADVGGTVDIASRPGAGTLVHITWHPGTPAASGQWLTAGAAPLVFPRISLILAPLIAANLWYALWLAPHLLMPPAVMLASAILVAVGGWAMIRGIAGRLGPVGSIATMFVGAVAVVVNGMALTTPTGANSFFWLLPGASFLCSAVSLYRPLREPLIGWVVLTVLGALLVSRVAIEAATWQALAPALATPILASALGVVVRVSLDRFAWAILAAEHEVRLSGSAEARDSELQTRLRLRLAQRAPQLLAFFRDVLSRPVSELSSSDLKRSAGILERELREELTVGDVPEVRQRLWRLRERGWTVALRGVGGWDKGLATAATEALDTVLDAPRVAAQDLTLTAMRGPLGRRLGLAVSGSASAAVGDALPPGWEVAHAATELHAVRRLTGPVVETDDWT
jgi:hypothetical protein